MARSTADSHRSGQEVASLSSQPSATREARPEDGKMVTSYENPHPSDLSGLEWLPPSSEAFATTTTRLEDGKILSDYGNSHLGYSASMPSVLQNNIGGTATASAGDQTKVPHSRRKCIYLAAGLAVFIVCAAAIVGGVLGARAVASRNRTDEQTNPSGAPPAISSLVAPNSRLSAVAWRDWSGFSRFLFYQDTNGTLRASIAAGTNLTEEGVDEAPWQSSKSLEAQYPVGGSTAIGATVLAHVYKEQSTPQIEMFYLNESLGLNGINYVAGPGFNFDSINNFQSTAMEGSEVATLWPYIAFQSPEGQLRFIYYGLQAGRHTGSEQWVLRITTQWFKHKSRLALVPTTKNFTELTDYGRFAVIYQQPNGMFTIEEDPLFYGARDSYPGNSTQRGWFTKLSTVTSSHILSFTAFSVASSSDPDDAAVTIFILYQNDAGVINQIHQDGIDGEWKISTPEAFQGADQGASISCVTNPIWPFAGNYGTRLLEAASPLNRCFFFKEGTLMETLLNGTDWRAPTEMKLATTEQRR